MAAPTHSVWFLLHFGTRVPVNVLSGRGKKKKKDELIRSEADAFFCDSGENQLKVGQHVWFDPVPNSATSLLTSLAQGFRTDFRSPRADENNTSS